MRICMIQVIWRLVTICNSLPEITKPTTKTTTPTQTPTKTTKPPTPHTTNNPTNPPKTPKPGKVNTVTNGTTPEFKKNLININKNYMEIIPEEISRKVIEIIISTVIIVVDRLRGMCMEIMIDMMMGMGIMRVIVLWRIRGDMGCIRIVLMMGIHRLMRLRCLSIRIRLRLVTKINLLIQINTRMLV